MNAARPEDFGFAGHFSTENGIRAEHSSATGILGVLPEAVAIPTGSSDVAALLTWAAATSTAIVPRGAATGMPGGNVGHGVAVDMVTHFRPPPVIDVPSRTARVGAGSILAELNEVAASFGLHFPVDPSSGSRCTLGGMIATNAAGAHSVRYGSTRPWVRGLEIVLADGTEISLRRGTPPPEPIARLLSRLDDALIPHLLHIESRWPQVRKNSSGYALHEYIDTRDAIDLLVGSEGTLALVTGAELDLSHLPVAVGLLILEFDAVEAAAEAVLHLLPLEPLTCEMLDRTFLDLVRNGGGDDVYPLAPGIEALLLVEIDAHHLDLLPPALERARALADPFAMRSTAEADPDRVRRLWQIRHAASPIIAREAGRRVSMQFIEDSVVPLHRLSEYVLGLREVLQRYQLPAVIFGHAGDGNLHVNPLVDVHDPHWRQTLLQVLSETAELVTHLGGTLAGEHGDGRLRAPLLANIWGDELVTCFTAVKNTFDPDNVLNPGVILPLPGQRPFEFLRKFA